ncbi:MAG: hypothetical protein HYV27_21220 [Candidatus Hydrogenedentes bacterium]|nr:hypothetical protein [Candidatus Hydrogenedentota bacterium]
MDDLHTYDVFGLTVRSTFPCPEFPEGHGEPDVSMSLGEVPDRIDGPLAKGVLFEASPEEFVLNMDGIAKYHVCNGNRITIAPAPGADQDSIRLFLVGSVFGALLHQRGMLPLHASAVEIDGGAILFCGESGAGKSTLAAAFAKRGYRVLADDLVVIATDAQPVPLALPGKRNVLLWRDALCQLELDPDSLPRVRPVLDKHAHPLLENYCDTPIPAKRIYVLSAHNQDTFLRVPVRGAKKFACLKNNTYRFRFMPGVSGKKPHMDQCSTLARHVEVLHVTRPRGGYRLEELVNLIEADCRS